MARRTQAVGTFDLGSGAVELVAREQSFRVVKPLLSADRERVEAADKARERGESVPVTETDSLSESLALVSVFASDNPEPVGDKLRDLSFGDWQQVIEAVSEVHGLKTLASLAKRLEELRERNASPRDSAGGGGGPMGESSG